MACLDKPIFYQDYIQRHLCHLLSCLLTKNQSSPLLRESFACSNTIKYSIGDPIIQLPGSEEGEVHEGCMLGGSRVDRGWIAGGSRVNRGCIMGA